MSIYKKPTLNLNKWRKDHEEWKNNVKDVIKLHNRQQILESLQSTETGNTMNPTVDDNGNKGWYLDGPAFEFANGDYAWYLNGKLHREDGPAFDVNGNKLCYLNGKELSESEWTCMCRQQKLEAL